MAIHERLDARPEGERIDTLSVLGALIEREQSSVPIRHSRARPRPVESG